MTSCRPRSSSFGQRLRTGSQKPSRALCRRASWSLAVGRWTLEVLLLGCFLFSYPFVPPGTSFDVSVLDVSGRVHDDLALTELRHYLPSFLSPPIGGRLGSLSGTTHLVLVEACACRRPGRARRVWACPAGRWVADSWGWFVPAWALTRLYTPTYGYASPLDDPTVSMY